MDYFREAFGGFNPLQDRDAALKFCLDALMADERLEDLERLIICDEGFGGVEGEPSWIIECRAGYEITGYETWPDGASFRAYVDPSGYSLAYPESYFGKDTFYDYVKRIVSVFKNRHPEHAEEIRTIEKLILGAA
jgi:hypothetical protein